MKHGTMWNIPAPLVYSKFYSSDISFITVWLIKSFNFKQGRMIPYIVQSRVKLAFHIIALKWTGFRGTVV